MNIAIISPNIYPCRIGGVEIFNFYLIKELATQGHKIWLLTWCSDYDWNNRNIHCVKLWRGFPRLTFLSIILHLIKLKSKIDMVHVPYTSNSRLPYPVLFIKKLTNIPYIIIIHGGAMYKWKQRILQHLSFKYANAIVAVSKIISKEYEKRCGRKIKVMPPLIPFEESKLSKEKLRKRYNFNHKNKIILYLGSMRKIKGSDILLDAFLKLGEEYVIANNIRLLYVGNGEMKDKLKKLVNEKNYHQYVKFLGNISHERVSEIYKLADIYVISSFFEGTPIALLEAMFNGLPIIGTNINGINTLIRHEKNGLLFEKGNIDDLKNKIRELIVDVNLAKRLGNSAKKDCSIGYTFGNMVSDHIKLYNKILER